MKDVFSRHYQTNYWADDESVSGHGSTVAATKAIRLVLPPLMEHYGIRSVLDIPCGDLNWAHKVKWPSYIGADIVPELVAEAKAKYPDFDLRVLNITTDPLPQVDLILCRDLLGHFSNADVKKALANIKKSGATYLLATTFPEHETSGNIETGEWRPINLASFFGLPDPLEYINENCTDGGGAFKDKSLGLWRLK